MIIYVFFIINHMRKYQQESLNNKFTSKFDFHENGYKIAYL